MGEVGIVTAAGGTDRGLLVGEALAVFLVLVSVVGVGAAGFSSLTEDEHAIVTDNNESASRNNTKQEFLRS